ncbi:hypothetical protein [Lactiplantibacillus daowaiensis]|uniref:Uncharacterized protein n=1 Tax=Lactiplantibacillus daowaiensis TaxID=2559918 RepID=A0ABW1RXM8_9LACO|nr:hypothetical protein [Lactiplantibacillus daowaiensis]
MGLKSRHQSTTDRHWLQQISGDKRVAWNFSFLSKEPQFNFLNQELVLATLLKKMQELNAVSVVAMLNLPKSAGIERIECRKVNGPLKRKMIPMEFGKLRQQLAGDKYCIIRFSRSGRIVGQMIDQTFYLFWIDTTHRLYNG